MYSFLKICTISFPESAVKYNDSFLWTGLPTQNSYVEALTLGSS